MPLLDSTRLLAKAALKEALGKGSMESNDEEGHAAEFGTCVVRTEVNSPGPTRARGLY